MTRDDDFIGQLEGYLEEYEGMTPLPAGARDAIRTELPNTRQFGPPFGPMRYLKMKTTMPAPVRYGLVAAAAIAAVVLGAALLGRGLNVGGEPKETPSGPIASPVILTNSGTIQNLAAGRYSIPPGPTTSVKLTFTLPAGWDTDGFGFDKHRGESGWVGLTTSVVGRVYTDTCAVDGTAQPFGSTIDDLVTALEGLGGATVSPAVDTTVGGFPAKRVDIVMPDVDVATCRVGILQIWADPAQESFNALDPGQQESVYITSVAGQLVVMFTTEAPDTSASDIAEVNAIIGSVEIGSAGP
jgi:hypothetical protein